MISLRHCRILATGPSGATGVPRAHTAINAVRARFISPEKLRPLSAMLDESLGTRRLRLSTAPPPRSVRARESLIQVIYLRARTCAFFP